MDSCADHQEPVASICIFTSLLSDLPLVNRGMEFNRTNPNNAFNPRRLQLRLPLRLAYDP